MAPTRLLLSFKFLLRCLQNLIVLYLVLEDISRYMSNKTFDDIEVKIWNLLAENKAPYWIINIEPIK